MVTAQVGDGSGRMSAVFFNQPWRERQLRPGMTVAPFGKADSYRGSLQMTNPVVDLIGDRDGAIVSIYPQSEKADLSTWEIGATRARSSGAGPAASRTWCHRGGRQPAVDRPPAGSLRHPRAGDDGGEARRPASPGLRRVVACATGAGAAEAGVGARREGIRHDVSGALVARFHERLPFTLTDDQRSVIAEIEHDLAGPHPMHRLLQGDVGSGKTVVAVERASRPPFRVGTSVSWRRPRCSPSSTR